MDLLAMNQSQAIFKDVFYRRLDACSVRRANLRELHLSIL
jgi:hypothetical protein